MCLVTNGPPVFLAPTTVRVSPVNGWRYCPITGRRSDPIHSPEMSNDNPSLPDCVSPSQTRQYSQTRFLFFQRGNNWRKPFWTTTNATVRRPQTSYLRRCPPPAPSFRPPTGGVSRLAAERDVLHHQPRTHNPGLPTRRQLIKRPNRTTKQPQQGNPCLLADHGRAIRTAIR